MKAIRVHQFGEPDVLVLEDVPDMTPGAGEVLVEVRAAGVNPADTYMRDGSYTIKPSLPYTPGIDGAGTVLRVGTGVTHVRPGARVYLAHGSGGSTGTYATHVVCSGQRVHPLPDRLSFAQGAGIGIPYGTAWRALMLKAQAQPGETVLVHGASGGVGIAAVQIARAGGLTVIGTAGTDRGRALVLEQGAHYALDHSQANYRDEIRRVTDDRGPDVIIEMLANVNLNHDVALVATKGRVVIVGSRGNIEFTPRLVMGKDAIVTGFTLWNTADSDLRRIHAAVGAGLAVGTLTPVVGQELPLADAPTAHRRVLEPGAYGKIVLTT
jgi:NADPH2:quinone reductase